jgi:hypothetical protein
VFGKLAAFTDWFVGLVREVTRGVAVGRGREPVETNSQMVCHASRVRRGAGSGFGMARKDSRARRRDA